VTSSHKVLHPAASAAGSRPKRTVSRAMRMSRPSYAGPHPGRGARGRDRTAASTGNDRAGVHTVPGRGGQEEKKASAFHPSPRGGRGKEGGGGGGANPAWQAGRLR